MQLVPAPATVTRCVLWEQGVAPGAPPLLGRLNAPKGLDCRWQDVTQQGGGGTELGQMVVYKTEITTT